MADRSSSAEVKSAFEHYYQAELTYLRDVGKAFAERHPALAGMLAERGGDPDVERLLEGFAFVAARLHQRIDDAVPELVESLVELLLPHYLRPTPATTIVEFRGVGEGARGAQTLQAGARVLSRPVRGTACQFRTSQALELKPIALVSQHLDDASASRPELSLSFKCGQGTGMAAVGDSIRLHLHGERPTATQLYLWFSRYVASVTVRFADGQSVELGQHAVRVGGFGPEETLFPWPSFSASGVRLLLEYATLPSKFLFLDVRGLARASHVEAEAFQLCVRFNRPPPLPSRLAEDALRIHCVPAANVFEASAEPIRTTVGGRSTLLRVSGVDPLHSEVFSVRSVVGVGEGKNRPQVYSPFHSFRHALSGHGQSGPGQSGPGQSFYKLSRQASPIDEGIHTFLQVHADARALPEFSEQSLSIEIEATNRSLPEELQVGDVCVASPDIPAGVAFANIGLISRPVRPSLGSELSWRFVTHLACNQRGLADLESLRAMLSLYCLQSGEDTPGARASQRRIQSIRKLTARSVTRVLSGAALLGTLYEVELAQEGFDSEGDAFLFGGVLQRVFSLNERMNSFAELRLTLFPSSLVYRWSPELLP